MPVFAVPAYGPQNDVTLKMPAFEWVHVQLHQQRDDKFITTDSFATVPINAGYFTVKEVVLDDEDGYQIRLTPQLTGKGQQWLTRKLLDAGLLKPVAAE